MLSRLLNVVMVVLFVVSACFHTSNHPLPFHLHLHEIPKFLDSEKCCQSANLFNFKGKKKSRKYEQDSIPECQVRSLLS